MRVEHILPIVGAMTDNMDSERLPEGFVLKRVNMRPDNTGDVLSNVPIPGTVDLSASMKIAPGTNKTVGWCKDNESNGIIWFVFNTLGNHCIFRYNGTITEIFYAEPKLGLTDNMVIAEVVDGRLYWNDGVVEPKSFNIQNAIDYTRGSGGYTGQDISKILPMIKKPPVLKPKVVYETKTDNDGVPIDFNNLRKKQWQAKYNYEYEDYQESVYSPISKVPLPETEVSATGKWVDEITRNNSLKITINTGGTEVKAINVAVRDSSQQNLGTFFTFKKVEKYDGIVQVIADDTEYDVWFYNNNYLENIDTEYGNAYYHDVPLKAKDMLLLDGKVLAMTNPTVGYDKAAVNFSIEAVEEDKDFASGSLKMSSVFSTNNERFNRCGIGGWGKKTITITMPDFIANATYRIIFKYPDVEGENPYPDVLADYIAGAVETADFKETMAQSLAAELRDKIDQCLTVPITFEHTATTVKITFALATTLDPVIISGDWEKEYRMWRSAWNEALETYDDYVYGEVVSASLSPGYKTLKKGQYHQFGIVYNDLNGRYNVVMGSKELYVNPTTALNRESVVKAKLTITSLPPSWATSYRIAYIPNNSYTYIMEVPAVPILTGDETNGIPTGQKFLKINQAILRMIDYYPNNTLEAYEWQNGDRIRQDGSAISYEILKEFTREYTVDDETQVETGFLVEANLTEVDDKIELIEIYRPNRTPQDKVFYETGDEYMIVNGFHQGDVNQVVGTPAQITLDFGDVYLRQRYSADVDLDFVVIEDKNFSDYYISSGIDIGRPVLKTDMKQSTLNRVVITENYIQNTEINRLNVMLPGSENKEVSEIYGDITRIVERGDTLKIIQPHKETSVFIGKNYAKDANGGDIVLVSDKTFGSTNAYENQWGSMYPKSVAQSDDYLYYFDSFTGDFLRSASNGTSSLPKEYGYQKYFDDKVRTFNAYTGNKDIVTSVSSNDQTIYVSFITDTIETIAFSEREGMKGFMFFLSFVHVPENFAWYGDKMFSFLRGKLYQHNVGSVNQFYGSGRLDASITMVSNKFSEVSKTFEALSLDSNGEWEAVAEIEKDNNYPFGQFTKIMKAMFRSIEGRIYSAVPRNILSRAGFVDMQNLYSGNKMSGDSIKITLNSVNFDKLREVKVISQV